MGKFDRLGGNRFIRLDRIGLGRIRRVMGLQGVCRNQKAAGGEKQGYHAHYVGIIRQRATAGPQAKKAEAKKIRRRPDSRGR